MPLQSVAMESVAMRRMDTPLKLFGAEEKIRGYDCCFNVTEQKKPIEFSAAGEFLSGHVSVPIRFRDRPH